MLWGLSVSPASAIPCMQGTFPSCPMLLLILLWPQHQVIEIFPWPQHQVTGILITSVPTPLHPSPFPASSKEDSYPASAFSRPPGSNRPTEGLTAEWGKHWRQRRLGAPQITLSCETTNLTAVKAVTILFLLPKVTFLISFFFFVNPKLENGAH